MRNLCVPPSRRGSRCVLPEPGRFQRRRAGPSGQSRRAPGPAATRRPEAFAGGSPRARMRAHGSPARKSGHSCVGFDRPASGKARATRGRAQKRTPRRLSRSVRVRFHAHAAASRAEADTRRAVSPFLRPNKRARHGPARRSGRAGAGAGLLAPDADSALSHESDEQSSYFRDKVLV